jgi:hypothetical protein
MSFYFRLRGLSDVAQSTVWQGRTRRLAGLSWKLVSYTWRGLHIYTAAGNETRSLGHSWIRRVNYRVGLSSQHMCLGDTNSCVLHRHRVRSLLRAAQWAQEAQSAHHRVRSISAEYVPHRLPVVTLRLMTGYSRRRATTQHTWVNQIAWHTAATYFS